MKTILFKNGVFHSGITEDDTFSSMTVSKGKITGTYKENPEGNFSKIIDLNGKHVYPCLIDGHVHMMLTIAAFATGFNICEITSDGVRPDNIADVKKKLMNYSKNLKPDEYIVCKNYIRTAINERRMPSRTELDEWCEGRPVVIYNIDGHSTAMSSKMLEAIGISSDGHSGVLEGEENERNQGKITDLISDIINIKTLAKGIAKFQNACAGYGISVVGALEGNGDSPRDTATALIARLSRHFDVGVRLYLQYRDLKRVDPYVKWMKHPRVGGCGDFEMDGASGSHSAAFSEKYTDTGTNAPCYYTQKEADELVRASRTRGFQIASHAIGDLAISRIVEALGKQKFDQTQRIEHCEFLNDDSFSKIADKKYAVMMQPGYAWIDKRYLNTYTQCLSQNIRDRMKFKTLYDAGIPVCGSSDSPVQDIDPYLQMLGMVDFYNEWESVSPYEAFTCYTKNASIAILEEDERGTLETGKIADFFVADRDFFKLSVEEIPSFRPIETYYSGHKYIEKKGTLGEFIGMLLKKPKKI